MSNISQTAIATLQAQRIGKRLFNHWKHKFEVAEHPTGFEILMPKARIQLPVSETHLNVHIQALDTDVDMQRLEEVVLDHLIRMAQEPLHAEWQHSNASTPVELLKP